MYHVNSIRLDVDGFDYSFRVYGRTLQGEIPFSNFPLFQIEGKMNEIYEKGSRSTLSDTLTRVVKNWNLIRQII